MPLGRARVIACSSLVLCVLMPSGARAASSVAVIDIAGRGFGHGVGMAQDGALEMGRRGMSLGQILGQFYPGTSYAHATGDVRVPVLSDPASAVVAFPDGGQVLDAQSAAQSPGFPISVPAGAQVVMSWDGARYTASFTGSGSSSPSTTTTAPHRTTTTRPTTTTTAVIHIPLSNATVAAAPAPLVAATPASPDAATFAAPASPGAATFAAAPAPASSTRPLWAVPNGSGAIGVPARGRAYRGVVEALGGPSGLRLINQVDVETYLVGMGEVQDPSWPLASLETQEIAARTYALRAMASGGEICDDTRCQVYLGVDGEYPAAQRAVSATAGTVLVSGGSLIDAVYSSNAAGYSASRLEGFGVDDAGYPYLRAAPYPSRDPVPWTVEVASADIVSRLGLTGRLTNLLVSTKGPSGRALTVTATAGGHTVSISGLAFAAAFGLRSTMIDAIRATTAASAPPPPLGAALQVLPDNAGNVAAVSSASAETTTTGLPLFFAGPSLGPPLGAGAAPVRRASLPVGLVILAVALLALVGAATIRTRSASSRLVLPTRRR